MDKLSILDNFQAAHDKYFNLLLKHYPTIPTDEPFTEFGPPELCDLAIEVQSNAICLGPKALERLCHLGLDVLYPFDNVVDLYNWRAMVKKERVDHTIYASIAIRIDSELKRMRRIFSLAADTAYEAVSTETFLVSKARYASDSSPEENKESGSYPRSEAPAGTHIDVLNVYAADSQAISQLENLEKGSSIASNISNVVSTIIQGLVK